MSRRCTVCDSERRDDIDRQLASSRTPIRRIASDRGLSEASVRRHFANHLPETLARATASAEEIRADDLLAEVRDLQTEARAILVEARSTADHGLALKALARLEKQSELVAKVLGLVDGHGSVNVNVSNVAGGTYPILEDVAWFETLLKELAIKQYSPPQRRCLSSALPLAPAYPILMTRTGRTEGLLLRKALGYLFIFLGVGVAAFTGLFVFGHLFVEASTSLLFVVSVVILGTVIGGLLLIGTRLRG